MLDVLSDLFSGGCLNQRHYALPIDPSHLMRELTTIEIVCCERDSALGGKSEVSGLMQTPIDADEPKWGSAGPLFSSLLPSSFLLPPCRHLTPWTGAERSEAGNRRRRSSVTGFLWSFLVSGRRQRRLPSYRGPCFLLSVPFCRCSTPWYQGQTLPEPKMEKHRKRGTPLIRFPLPPPGGWAWPTRSARPSAPAPRSSPSAPSARPWSSSTSPRPRPTCAPSPSSTGVTPWRTRGPSAASDGPPTTRRSRSGGANGASRCGRSRGAASCVQFARGA